MSVQETVSSFVYTKWNSRKSLTREQFEHAQALRLKRWLSNALPQVEAFDTAPKSLTDLPIMDKSQLMNHFSAYNVANVTADQVRNALHGDFRLGKMTVGASTGTSGNRGLFIISERERFRWLGSIIAKTISDLLLRKQRIAIILPQGGALYESANRFKRIDLKVFDLVHGVDSWLKTLKRFDPTVIVAPPKVLRYLAETASSLSPTRIFSAAETLDPMDRPVIEHAFGMPVRQIYMATEGLLGVSCHLGNVHLAEDSVFFEYEAVGNRLVNPIITSFRRETQILARYRMNDLLRLSETRCACGSPLQMVQEVVGRMDDCFRLNGPQGTVFMTPDILRNCVLDIDQRIDDFRIIQMQSDQIDLTLKPDVPKEQAVAAKHALESLFLQHHAECYIQLKQAELPFLSTRKLRRVECRLTQGTAL